MFVLTRRHVIAMAVDPDRVVEGLDILPDNSFGGVEVGNTEPVHPFPLDQRMEGLNAGIVVRVALM